MILLLSSFLALNWQSCVDDSAISCKQYNMSNHKIIFKLDAIPERTGIYIVGGAVRDRLLGADSHDIDIAVQGNPQNLATQIANRTHSRVIPLGQRKHALFRVVTPSHIIDITALQGGSIEADLNRRDFTINAIAYEVWTHNVIDVTRGIKDIRDRQIRLVSPTGYQADPIRLLRTYRLASQLGFQIAADTRRLLHQEAASIRKPAVERIQAELASILAGPRVHYWLKSMTASRILFHILPELEALVGCRQGRQHEFDVFDHSLQTVLALENLTNGLINTKPEIASLFDSLNSQRRIHLHLAALLHDIGKPISREKSSSGHIRFHDHDKVGARISAAIGKRLRLPGKNIESIVQLVRHHLRPLHLFKAFKHNQLGSKGMTRFFMQTQGFTNDLLMLSLADMRAKTKEPMEFLNEFENFLANVVIRHAAEFIFRSETPALINGFDLIHTLHLTPSPLFKTILRRIREAQLSGQITDAKEALALAATIASQMSPSSGNS